MTRADIDREFIHVCREYRVDGREMIYGKRTGRPCAGLVVQLARWTFMLRVLRTGAIVRDVAEALQMSTRNVRRLSGELRRRGLVPKRPPRPIEGKLLSRRKKPMGTRALVRVFEGPTEILTLYFHSDGYPDGVGRQIAEFCETKRIFNGIRGGVPRTIMANGAGCLAAQLVANFKEDVGGVYVIASGSNSAWVDYEYHVNCPVHTDDANDVFPNGQAIEVLGFDVERGDTQDRKLTRVDIPSDRNAVAS